MQELKTIIWDDRSIKSIKSAERKKITLENKGYNLDKEEQVNANEWALIYKS